MQLEPLSEQDIVDFEELALAALIKAKENSKLRKKDLAKAEAEFKRYLNTLKRLLAFAISLQKSNTDNALLALQLSKATRAKSSMQDELIKIQGNFSESLQLAHIGLNRIAA